MTEEVLVAPVLHHIVQDDFVRLLNFLREDAWDIPSVLLIVCAHDVVDRKKYPGFGEFPMHRESQSYWDGLNPWPDVDIHFREVHGLDLDDSRINWNFDT